MAEPREVRRCIDAASAALPNEWRRVLQLRYVDGRTANEVSKMSRKPEQDIDRILEHARQYLRRRLLESGCVFGGGESGALRRAER